MTPDPTISPQQAPSRRIASWHPATVGQWPGRVATVIGLWGCPFTCEDCSGQRTEPTDGAAPSWDEIVGHVRTHGHMLDSVIVTGGEPLDDPDLPGLLAALNELGLDVLLETNGSRPDVLAYLIAESLITGVALDIKTVPARYRDVSPERDMPARVAECADMLITSGIEHEFRTVLRPGLVEPADVPRIARTLQGGHRYTLERAALDPLHDAPGFDDASVIAAARACERFLPTVVLDLTQEGR